MQALRKATIPEIVWNRGIAALCDWRIPDEFSSGSFVPWFMPCGHLTPNTPDDVISDPDVFRNVKEGDIVYVRVAWLKAFLRQVLPQIQARFILATGDSDCSVPGDIAEYADLILRSGKIIRWFAQNCSAPLQEQRFSRLPIGVDFHTISVIPFWGEPKSGPVAQEEELSRISGLLPPLPDRVFKAYVDFAWQPQDVGNRHKLLADLASNQCIHIQQGMVPRSEVWRRRGDYVFLVSPFGVGMDCHRTWEALVCGHIVITPRSPLEPMYEGLAVASIDDPGEINNHNLRLWYDTLAPLTSSRSRLSSRYWVNIMRRLVGRPELKAPGGQEVDAVVPASI